MDCVFCHSLSFIRKLFEALDVADDGVLGSKYIIYTGINSQYYRNLSYISTTLL